MGTWRTFDVPLNSANSLGIRQQIANEALAAGVTLFDSSPMYGSAEAVLGHCLEERRNDAVVATKVWSGSIAEGRSQIGRALDYFGGYVDLYQIHNLVQWRQYLPILRELRSVGSVKLLGITHYAHTAFDEMAAIMEIEDIQTIQIPYNAADDLASRTLLPLAEERDIGVIVMSPLGTGELVSAAPDRGELATLEAFGVETWAQALLKWVVSDERVTSVIPATSRLGRMLENARAGEPPLFGPPERERVSWLARASAGRH